ncbi:helix-turn-helix domain-containing protein, partial [Streptococcus orisratti]|uniref:helix-turn-helix domain-containing protein n=1 Tax=Streptococcus orisratti TaxID=114652 RepID=UPI003CFEA705
KPFSAIAAKLGKDPSTISKEVRRNRVVKENSVTSNCEACPLLKKAPYVCNACPKKRTNCGYQKQFYYAKRAQLDYEAKLSDSRTGVALNKEEFYR